MEDSLKIDSVIAVKDTIHETAKMFHHTEPIQYIDWSPWVLLIATLSLAAAVLIPLIQEIIKQKRDKESFEIFVKKKIGAILNQITGETIDYHEPSVKNEIVKEQISLKALCSKIKLDHEKHKSTVQPRIIFTQLMNIQNLLHFIYRLRLSIQQISFDKLSDQILEHGKNLTDKKRKEIYGLLLVLESFVSITLFHDKFGDLKSIKRNYDNKLWTGLKLEKDFIDKQEILNEDLTLINDKENNLFEIISMTSVLVNEIESFYNFKELQSKRKKTATNNRYDATSPIG